MANEVRTRALLLTYTLTKDFFDPSAGQTIPAGTVIVLLPETHAGAVLVDGTSTLGDLWGTISSGTCSTAAATAAKNVTVNGFTLREGAVVIVTFANTNTAASPTLNVNGTGAKNIYFQGSAIESGWLIANNPYLLRYNGNRYDVVATDLTIYQTQLLNFNAILSRLQGRVTVLETQLAEVISWATSQGYEATNATS